MQTIRYELEYYRWSTIIVVLSLDVAAPYITAMGLNMPLGYQPKLRRLMEDDLSRAQSPDFDLAVTEVFLEWLAQSYGRAHADNLFVWGVKVFEKGGMDYSMEFWRDLASPYTRNIDVSTPQFVLTLREMLLTYPDAHVYDLPPASDWDRRVYKHQEYDNLMSAMELVQATIDRYIFRKAWSTVRDRYPALYDIAAIKTWGTQTAVLKKMPVARLGDPGSWPDLPKLL